MLDHVIQWLRKYAPVLLLAVGSLLLYVFVSIEFWSVVGSILGVVIGAFLAVVSLIWNRFRGHSSVEERDDPDPLDVRIPVILLSVYIGSMIVLFRFATYSRPLLFYVLFGGYAGIIGYQIARGERKQRIIPQILVLAFFTFWSSQFLFPAGMYAPDTHYRYIPAIKTILSTGRIPVSETIYAGHLGYIAEFAFVSDLSIQISYYLLATIVLTGTVILLASIDRVLPALSSQTALYAALIFSITGWMLGRGMHPNKLNFFYPLILLVGLATIRLFRSNESSSPKTTAWIGIVAVVSPAIIFGHQFSAGAALVFLTVLGTFSLICQTLLSGQYRNVPQRSIIFVVVAYLLAVLGNPIHQGAILFRFSELILSIVQSGAASASGGGPGRYSTLPTTVLFFSTAAQTLLFALSIMGSIWIFRKKEWEYDLVLFWLGSISVLLVVSVLQNSADTAPQRFYSLLTLFGFNVCTGAFLYYVGKRGLRLNKFSVDIGYSVVVVLIVVLAVMSLASPIADKATSPVSDEVPHFRQFDTAQLNEGNEWTQSYGSTDINRIVAPRSDVPIQRTGRITGEANITSLESAEPFVYSALANRTGVVVSGGLSLGGRIFVFVASPSTPADEIIYTNGQTTIYRQQ